MNRNERTIVGLVMVAHGLIHTYELSIPILVTIWLKEFGVTEATIGLVVTAGYGLFGLGALPGGILADRIGSKKLIIASFLGMGGAFLFLSTAPSVLVIALALLVWGAAASVYHPSALTLLSKEISQRGTGFAYHGIAGTVGVAAGPFAMALLLQVLDWRQAAAAIALPAVVAGVLAFKVRITETPGSELDDRVQTGISSLNDFLTGSKKLFKGAFIVVFIVVIFSGLYYRGVLTFLPDLIAQFPGFEAVKFAGRMWEPSRYFYAGILMVGVFGQYAGGKLSDRISENTEYGLAFGFGVLAVIALLFLPAANLGFTSLLVLGSFLGFFIFFVQPLYQAAVAEYTAEGSRGMSYGYMYLGTFGVGSLGGAIAGAILTYFTQNALFLALALFAAAASTLGVGLGVKGKKFFGNM